MHDTGYKIKWRSIIVIGGLAIIGGYFLQSEMTESGHVLQHYVAPSRSTNAPARTPPSQTESHEVIIGQFRCSAKDAAQVKRLTPIETQGQLESDKEALDAKGRELGELQMQIDAAPANNPANPSELDYRNQMVDQYNLLQSTYESDTAALKQRIDAFNSQIEAHDSYLEQHCTRTAQ